MANPNGNIAGHLREEHLAQQTLFEAQPPLVQRFLEAQGRQLAESLAQRERPSQVRFTLPDKVVVEAHKRGESKPVPVPAEFREQLVGGLIDRLTRGGIRTALRQRLSELDQSLHRSVAVSAKLIRYATVMHMVHNMLPAGRSVTYVPAEGEEIPTHPRGRRTRTGLGHHGHDRRHCRGRSGGRLGAGSCKFPMRRRPANSTCPAGWRSTTRTTCWSTRSARPRRTSTSMQRFLGILHMARLARAVHRRRRGLSAQALRHVGPAHQPGPGAGALPDRRDHSDHQAASSRPRPQSRALA